MEPVLGINGEITWQDVEGEVVILDTGGRRYFTVSESAVPLWRMLAGGTTRAALVSSLSATHGLAAHEAAADVDAFLEQLRAGRLLDPPA